MDKYIKIERFMQQLFDEAAPEHVDNKNFSYTIISFIKNRLQPPHRPQSANAESARPARQFGSPDQIDQKGEHQS